MKARWREMLAAAIGATVIITGLASPLTQRSERVAGSNARSPVSDDAILVAPGDVTCQPTSVPPGARSLRVYAGTGTAAGAPVTMTLRGPGGFLLRRAAPGGYLGDVPLSFELAAPAEGADRICLRNGGRFPVWFASIQPRSSGQTALGDREFRTDYLYDGTRSSLQMADEVADRASLMKSSLIGDWTIWLALAAALLLPGAAACLVLRSRR